MKSVNYKVRELAETPVAKGLDRKIRRLIWDQVCGQSERLLSDQIWVQVKNHVWDHLYKELKK